LELSASYSSVTEAPAAMATVTEKVKDTLLGVEQLPQVSEQNRAEFLTFARKDEETGEYYMTEAEFIDAIAPASEDYVQLPALPVFLHSYPLLTHPSSAAQNKARPILNPLQSRRPPGQGPSDAAGMEQLREPARKAGRRV
jgi:hypothetical protein